MSAISNSIVGPSVDLSHCLFKMTLFKLPCTYVRSAIEVPHGNMARDIPVR